MNQPGKTHSEVVTPRFRQTLDPKELNHSSYSPPVESVQSAADHSVWRPLVTIMIPTYGQAAVLATAIESALSQDYQNLEVLVSDDFSPDGTPELMSRYADEPRLRYVRSSVNRGRVENYRHTLEVLARGEYVLNLDGDDWLCDSTYISDAIQLISSNPGLVLVFARAQVFDQAEVSFRDLPLTYSVQTLNDGTSLFMAHVKGQVPIPHLTALYSRQDAIRLGFYRIDVLGADSVGLLSMLPGRDIGFVDRTVAVWRKHSNNATWTVDLRQRLRNFAVADIPAATAVRTGVLTQREATRWSRDMAVAVAQSFVEDCLVRGAWWAAARFLVVVGFSRPQVGMQVVTRIGRRAFQRLVGSKR